MIFDSEDVRVIKYYSKKAMMEAYADFLNDAAALHLYIYSPTQIKIIFKKFCDEFKNINAGGGLVKNAIDQKYLFIFRKGKWDLPKGKQDPGENIRTTSVREVEEETSIDKVEITKKLLDTYHIYMQKHVILKKTSWYLMETNTNLTPVPQIAEDITEVKWLSTKEIETIMDNTYPSIKLLVDHFFKKKRRNA